MVLYIKIKTVVNKIFNLLIIMTCIQPHIVVPLSDIKLCSVRATQCDLSTSQTKSGDELLRHLWKTPALCGTSQQGHPRIMKNHKSDVMGSVAKRKFLPFLLTKNKGMGLIQRGWGKSAIFSN